MVSAPAALRQERLPSVGVERWVRTHRAAALASALGLYAALAFVYWGLPLAGHWTTRLIGAGSDPRDVFIWAMAWWPYALTHGVNPFQISNVWVPLVTNAGWRTLVPGLSLLLAPLTLTAGPVAAYNAAMLLAPALTAAAMCLLMYELAGRAWISLWAGAAVGFSSYEVSQMLAHLNLTSVWLVPLALWVGVRLYRHPAGRVPWRPVAGLAAVLVGQFLIASEILASFTLMVAVGGLMAWWLVPGERAALRRLAIWAVAAYALAGVVLAPWLWAMVHPLPFSSVGNRFNIAVLNVLNLVVPTSATVGGQWFSGVNGAFAGGNVPEASGYLGWPLLAMMGWVVVRWRRQPAVRMLSILAAVMVVMAMGPVLEVGHWVGPPLPWHLFLGVPLLTALVTGRFMLYVVILAVGLVGWGASQVDADRTVRWLTAGMLLALVAVLPNFSYPGLSSPAVAPPLVTNPRLLGRYVQPNASVMVLPYFNRGPATFWQAQSGFRFRLADGYLYSAVNGTWTLLYVNSVFDTHHTPASRYAAMEFDALLRMGGVSQVMVAQPQTARDAALLRRAGLRLEAVAAGVALWQPPPAILAQPHLTSAGVFRLALATRIQVLRLDAAAVVKACQRYDARPHRPPVTLWRLERAHLLAGSQGSKAAPVAGWQTTKWGVWLHGGRQGAFSLAVRKIPRATFRALVRQFRPDLSRAFFAPMPRLSRSQPRDLILGEAVLQFKPAGGGP